MSRYLLDTNIVSDVLNDPWGRTGQRLALLENEDVGVNVIVAAELRYGAQKKASASLASDIDRLLADWTVEPLKSPIDRVYARLRASPELMRQPLGANDLWIAAHALTLDYTLVSDDRAFERVPGLKFENWLAA